MFKKYILIYIKLVEKNYVVYSGAHSLNVLSYDEDAMYLESGDISTPIILLSCPDNVFNICHVLFAQI